MLGPSIVAEAEFSVVTAAFDATVKRPYVTDGILQRKFDEFGIDAVLMVIMRTPEALMLAMLAPRPPSQLAI